MNDFLKAVKYLPDRTTSILANNERANIPGRCFNKAKCTYRICFQTIVLHLSLPYCVCLDSRIRPSTPSSFRIPRLRAYSAKRKARIIRTHISLLGCIISHDFSGVIAKLFNQEATITTSRRVYFNFSSSRFCLCSRFTLLSKSLHRCAWFLPALRRSVFGSMICRNPVFLYHK